MGQISVDLPVIGNPVSSEDRKVREALADIVQEINGRIDNNNLAEAGVANINGDRLADTSVPTAKLENDAVTADKLRDDASTDANRAVTTNHIRDDAVTADKLRDDASTDANRAVTTNHIRNEAITSAKIAPSTTGTATIASGGSGTITARKYADGLVVLDGDVFKTSGTWSAGTTIATLPAGYRPATSLQPVVWGSSNPGATCVTIATTGVISIKDSLIAPGVAAPFIGVSGIAFHAA